MKLIAEEMIEGSFLVEEKNGEKEYFVEGVFLQTNIKNRNGRVYPKEIMQKEVRRYNQEYISKKRAFGELGHPEGAGINLDRVSHMITSLTESGDNFMGRAKIMDTPYGQIVKNFIKEGAQLGVSSRALGTLKKNRQGVMEVQKDLYLATAADIVADPSAPNAFVNGLMEGREFYWDGKIIGEQQIDSICNMVKGAKSKEMEKTVLEAFDIFMKSISK